SVTVATPRPSTAHRIGSSVPVIPGRPKGGPGIHEHGPLEYGFRARRCAAPRNDSVGWRPPARRQLVLCLGGLPQRDLVEQGLDRAAGKAERGLVDEAA